MVRYLPILLAGILCPVVTYKTTREGMIFISVALVVVLAIAAVVVSARQGSLKWYKIASSFAFGTGFSELVIYFHWYFRYGYQDPKGDVGLVVTIIEFVVITSIGIAAVTIVHTYSSHK